MARTKQTARHCTGSMRARKSTDPAPPGTGPCIQASSTDTPLTAGEYRFYQMVAQNEEDDLTREAGYRYDDEVLSTLTGRISRKRREDCIAVLKKQIVMEREYAAA